ncbi:MAG: bifunctional diguanylate cyclase/phosphodiesterase [Acidiferrobacterales bacterium]
MVKHFHWYREQLRSPLARRLNVAIVLFSLGITLLLTLLQLYGQYRHDMRGIDADLRQIKQVHLEALTQSLWATNEKDLLLQLQGIVHIPKFEYAAVRDGKTLWAQAGSRRSVHVIEKSFPMVYAQEGRKIPLGTLNVVVSLDDLYRQLLTQTLIILASNSLQIFLMAGFAFVFFHWLVNRHLQTMAAYVRDMDMRKLAPPLILAQKGHRIPNELDELVTAINHMRENTRATLSALQTREEQFELASEAADVGLWDWNPQDKSVYLSPVFKRQLGYRADELPSHYEIWESRLHTEDRVHAVEAISNCLAGHVSSYEVEYRLRHKDNSYHWFLSRGALKRDESGRPIRLLGVQVDISARKQTEQQLRESEERARTVAENSPIGIFLANSDGNVIYSNRAFHRIVGVSADEPALNHWFDLIQFADRERALTAWQDFIHGRRPDYDIEIRFVTGLGERLTHTRAAAIREGDRLIGYAGTAEDITDRRRAEEQLGRLAHYDSLTALPNRVLFSDRLSRAMIEADRHERLVGVAFLDLDRFKNINDTLGHDTGDMLLKAVAERLAAAMRKGDTVARLSGDEFTLILADMGHIDDAARVAQKVLDAFAQPFFVAGRELHITASLGITLYPFDVQDVSGLLRNADIAMYRAKEQGRNVYRFYSADMTIRAIENLALENDLRHAVARDELVLHYQPIIECATGKILSMEALVRWRHGQRGLIPPSQFIPLAEDTGLIVPVGEWVLREACAQCRRWRREFRRPLRVAVNLSARQFGNSPIARVVRQILDDTDLDPAALELEITESVLLHHDAERLESLRTLAEMGVTLTIDDFGTGYSSLSYLKRFPVEALKIDQSFTHDIPDDPDDTALARAIISMAHTLGMKTIAEGVETRTQFEFFRSEHCDSVQGFYFSKPLPASEFAALLANNQLVMKRT